MLAYACAILAMGRVQGHVTHFSFRK